MADQNLNVRINLEDKASRGLKALGSQVNKTSSFFKSAALATALTAAAAGMLKLGKSALIRAAEFEQTEIAFTTMLGSAEDAQSLLKELAEFASKTPFTIKGIQDNTRQLLAMGIEQEKIMPTLKALGDVAAGLSIPLSRLALNFGQVKAQGRLTGRELRDFAIAGVPLLDQLAVQLGKSTAEITKMVSKGEIGFAEVEQAFVSLSEEGGRFNNLMNEQSKSLNGMISNLGDAWSIFLRGEGSALVDWGKQIVSFLTFMVREILPVFILKIKDTANAIADFLVPIIIGLQPAFETTVDFIKEMDETLNSLIDTLVLAFNEIGKFLSAAKNLGVSTFKQVASDLGFGGARANGGPVQAGKTFLVGENGPELFTPSVSGGIVPNNKLGGGGVTNNFTGVFGTGAAEEIGDMIINRLNLHSAT